MGNFKNKTVFVLPNGREAELSFTPEDWLQDKTVVRQLKDGQGNYMVGMILHDRDCSDPLEDDDWGGQVIHHPNSKYGKSEGYYEAMGLDRHGDPVIDEEKLQQMWHDRVMALSLQDFFVSRQLADHGDAEDLRELLATEYIVGDYSFDQNARSAWAIRLAEADQDELQELIDKVEAAMVDWSYSIAEDLCRAQPDKYAVLLDVYEHGERAYSISGTGMQCRWDTSRGEAIWAATGAAKDEVDSRAEKLKFGLVQDLSLLRGPGPKWLAVAQPYGQPEIPLGRFEHFCYAADALANWGRDNAMEPTPEQAEAGFQAALLHLAKCSVAEYDAWQRGECYALVWIEVTPEGDEVQGEGPVGGIIGSDSAEEELLAGFPADAVTC